MVCVKISATGEEKEEAEQGKRIWAGARGEGKGAGCSWTVDRVASG